MSQVTKIVIKQQKNSIGAPTDIYKVAKISNPKTYLLKDLKRTFNLIDDLEKYVKERSNRDTVIEIINAE